MNWTTHSAALFDLDGVLTPTAEVHMLAWAEMFNGYLRARGSAEPYTDADYFAHVDGRPRYDGVRRFLRETGYRQIQLELISLDDDWQAATCDSVAAQIRDAGINIKRTILPGSTYWNDWTKYPFSATEWNMRPLGVQVMASAYRTGEAWNETAFSNAEFDEKMGEALAIADAS